MRNGDVESAAVKRILYVSSARDRRWLDPPIETCYAQGFDFGMGAILYNLRALGWENRRLGLREAWQPWGVARALREFRPRLAFTYGGVTSLQTVAARRLARWRGPVVHGWDDYYDEIWRAAFGSAASLVMRLVQYLVVTRSDYVVTLSRYNQQRAERWGKKAWYIPNGCDVPQYDPAACKLRLEGRFNIVYVGDQSRYKLTHELVAAMARVPADVRLYLIGRPYRHLQRTAPPNAVFLGFLSRNDMWALMSQADVLACTADQDCNAKFHEYLRMGKPILCRAGKAAHLFRHRETAYLATDYAAAIRELDASPELRRALAAKAARAIPVYTWREIAAQFDAAFAEMNSTFAGDPFRRALGRLAGASKSSRARRRAVRPSRGRGGYIVTHPEEGTARV
jgi:glycosyltransferase involved in cell wall biosynthesis